MIIGSLKDTKEVQVFETSAVYEDKATVKKEYVLQHAVDVGKLTEKEKVFILINIFKNIL